jgi:antirestriction protein
MQNVITHSWKKLEKLKTVVSDHQELAALERRIADEKTKNCSLEKVNSELREQLEVQRKAHQEQLREQEKAHQKQLKDQRKAHQGKPLLPSSTCIYQFILDSEKTLHHRT